MFSTIHHELEGLADERFRSLASQLRRLQRHGAPAERLDALCRDEILWAKNARDLHGCRERYEACVRVLTDLAKLRWKIVQDGFGVELATPNARKVRSSDIAAYKQSVRLELDSQIRQQFDAKSVRDFIRQMENPTASSKKKSVLELIADGRELSSRLLAARETRGAERVSLCGEAVRPYLQLVNPDAKDRFTGHQLSDIWRYFRYTWSIPATNVPGRNLFYLIRDSAHPSHAVMGITALSNAPLALGDRDRALGWTAASTQGLVRRLAELPEQQAASALGVLLDSLEEILQLGLDSISHDQLLRPGEAENPTEHVIARLRRLAAEFATRRENILSASEQPETLMELEEQGNGDPAVSNEVLRLESKVFGDRKMDAARRALTAKKRAAELARLLQARIVLHRHRERLLTPVEAPTTYERDDVVAAVNAAWVCAKSARAGSSMLEMTVCGAVRPYNHILGGKLAALLMLSPEVADDYRLRYGSAVSIISSMMKNEPVVKDCRLVFLGTTSLYLHGASQYHRVRLPARVISPQQAEIRYEPMGETAGFGTVQFSADTVDAVEKVVTATKGYRQVNSVFGEGRSPKLRKLRTGLDLLGFDAEMLLRHHQPRVIYGVRLFPGADEFLRSGLGEMPDFIQDPSRFRDATERIAAYWRERWLSHRLDHVPVFASLNECHDWALSQCTPVEQCRVEEQTDEPCAVTTIWAAANPTSPSDASLWESLAAAGHASCSDCVSESDLDRLHVPSPLEDFLVKRAEDGFSLILTGNAGDGKTHLLRRIAPALEASKALVDLDATAVMRKGAVGPILDRWRAALAARRPYCIAANEYPLHLLIRGGKGVLPEALHAELLRQNRERLAYSPTPETSEQAREKLLVVDLSLRNPLNPAFSLTALRRMLADPAVVERAESGSDPNFAFNYRKLCAPRVQERLGGLFQRLAQRGHRSTIRELWICLARMLFGDPSERADGAPPAGSPRSWYATRLWPPPSSVIRFRLAQLLAETDPASSSHPYWDARLEYPSELERAAWLDDIPQVQLDHPDPKVSVQRFAQLKRRFYFEHDHGDLVFALDRARGGDFTDLLEKAATADEVFKGRLLRDINHAYCPVKFSSSDRDLFLWFSHRYHEQPTRTYVASRCIPAACFDVRLPRLPCRLEGAFDYRPDHLVLDCAVGSQHCRLSIDAATYCALERMGSGLPRHLASERELNKLDDFLSRLQKCDVPETRQFIIYSGEKRLATRVTLDETFSQYRDVEKL